MTFKFEFDEITFVRGPHERADGKTYTWKVVYSDGCYTASVLTNFKPSITNANLFLMSLKIPK